MILEFSFKNVSTSYVLEKILARELQASNLKGALERIEDFTSLFVQGEEKELTEFSDKLAREIPYSIFIKDSAVKVVESMPENSFEIPRFQTNYSYCPKCVSEVEDETHSNYYNPFTSCEVCGYGVKEEPISLQLFEKKIVASNKDEYKHLFRKLATVIENGANVEIKTFSSGTLTIGKFTKENVENLQDFFVISSDLASLDNFAIATKEEVYALGSMEKPLVNLKFKLNFRGEHDYLSKKSVEVKLADDFLLFLALRSLREHGVGFVYATTKSTNCQIQLDFSQEIESTAPPKVAVLETKDIVIIDGERSLQPMELVSDEPSVEYFQNIVNEYKVSASALASVYLSKAHNDKIMFYAEKIGVMSYIHFNFNFDSFKNLFERIESSDDVAKKLIDNFKSKESQTYEYLLTKSFEKQTLGIYRLFGVLSFIFGFYKGDSLEEAAEKLLENAHNFLGKKGPSIDYKPIKVDDKFYLDIDKTIRSAMSYKLAGSDSEILSFGILESLATFLSDIIDNIHQDMEIDGVVLGGELFASKALLNATVVKIKKNNKIFFPKVSGL